MSVHLTGQQMRLLHEALLDAFPNEGALHRLVRFELEENLLFITKSSDLSDMVFTLIGWAEANDTLVRLILGAQNTNAANPKLRAFIGQLPAEVLSTSGEGTSGHPGDAFTKWRDLIADVQSGKCTPILGPGLLEPLLGSPQEMARRWAARHGFPLAPHAQDDLPQVAQFLATVEKAGPGVEFHKYLTAQLLERHGARIPTEARGAPPDELLRLVAAARWADDPRDPYRVLAALPCRIYLTANADNLLAEALRAAGKEPEVELCRWRDDKRWPPSVYDREPGYQPSVARPLVYHLFGRLPFPFSLVLKEDDYFDFLTGVARNSRIPPSSVRVAWADSALLFLGFRMDDWSFRVLFHSITGSGNAARRGKHAHVAVQLDPQPDSAADPARARYYLETFFESSDVSIYWGKVEQFLADLQRNWADYQAGAGGP